MVKLKARTGLSLPKDEAAAKRIKAGTAKADDWSEVKSGATFATVDALRKELLAAGDAEEVSGS